MLAGEITGDDSAQNHPRLGRQATQHRVEDVTADVVVVDVHPLGAVHFERRGDILVLVVDAGIEPEVIHHHAAFLRAAGDAHHAGAGDLRDLAGDGSRRPGGGGHDDGLPRLRAADLHHPEIRCGAAGSVDRHNGGLIGLAGDRRAEHVVADDGVFLKAGERGDDVTDGVGRAARFDDLADSGGADHLTEGHRRQVTRLIVEPGANGGVESDIGGAQQCLTVARARGGGGEDLGIFGADESAGAAAQDDLAVGQHGCEATRSSNGPD